MIPLFFRFSWVVAGGLLAFSVQAQPRPAAPETAVARANPSPVWLSAFDGYRRFDDAPLASWRESNDTVGRIGGWRAYARQAPDDEGVKATPPNPPPVAPSSGAGHSHGAAPK